MSYIEQYILGIKIHPTVTLNDAVLTAAALIKDQKCHYMCTTNPEFIMHAQYDSLFKEIINKADLSVVDGSGVAYASRYVRETAPLSRSRMFPFLAFVKGLELGVKGMLNHSYLNIVSGVALVDSLCAYASSHDLTVFLLGGWPKDFFGNPIHTPLDVATLAAHNLKSKYPKLRIIGATSQFKHLAQDDAATIAYIKKQMSVNKVDHIDMLFVAYNHPNQEKWIYRNKEKIPSYLSIGVGGTLDYFSGLYKRAPNVFINMNLEWLYRLFTQPRRIKRILTAFPIFPLKVYLSLFKH